MFVQDTFDFSQFSVGHTPQGGIPDIYVDIRVGFQIDFELLVGTWFLAVRCAEIEVIEVVIWEDFARVYLWVSKYLFVYCEIYM